MGKTTEWTIAGYNDEKEFKEKPIINGTRKETAKELIKELKDGDDKEKILELALSYIGRTPPNKLKKSRNDHDWLGTGIYFWEDNHRRATEFVEELETQEKTDIGEPFAIGVAIDLGYCLNLLDSEYFSILKSGHDMLCRAIKNPEKAKDFLPNFDIPGILPTNTSGTDLLRRRLDCAVFEIIHAYRRYLEERPFDSVRAVFTEGERIYRTAGFKKKTHIQLCIRNPNCIKGYFRVLNKVGEYSIP